MESVEWLPTPLTAARVSVRRPQPGDETMLAQLYTNLDVRRFVGGPLDLSDAQRRALQAVTDEEWGTFVIATIAGATIGSGDIRRKRGPWELSYQLDPAYWGQGLASEAVTTLVRWFFDATPADLLIAVTQEDNQRSSRLLERCGALLTETFEQYGAPQRRYEFHRLSPVAPA